MSDLYWLTDEQMARLRPYFPKSHGKPRVDDRRVLSGIIFVNRNGSRWCDLSPVNWSVFSEKFPVRWARPTSGPDSNHAWRKIRGSRHKPFKLVAVAIANKLARIAFAVMTTGTSYRAANV